MLQVSPAASSRSMMVGMCLTLVRSNAPPLGWPSEKSGTQLGSLNLRPLGEIQGAILLLSQPQPPTPRTPFVGVGVRPQKPSVLAATAYMCPSQEGLSDSEKVMSLMANFLASLEKFGSS